jgi:hypothetical protein
MKDRARVWIQSCVLKEQLTWGSQDGIRGLRHAARVTCLIRNIGSGPLRVSRRSRNPGHGEEAVGVDRDGHLGGDT